LFGGHIIYLSSLAPKEEFQEDHYLNSETNKTAIIIVAHDDDAISFAGTVSRLTEQGWDVTTVCFYGSWKSEENQTRKEELQKAAALSGIKNLEFVDVDIVNGSDTVAEPWMPVPYNRFQEYFKLDTIRYIITNAIFKYKPSVIFTLDDTIGGYGHPQHIAVSRCVNDVCRLFKDTVDFPVRKIYQAVFPHSQTENIVGNMPAYRSAKKIYGVDGMPNPDVYVSIADAGEKKKDFMCAFKSQQQSIRKIWPYYNWYPAWLYFGIFDKEFFRTLDVKTL
jgi:LmbE family N-acetylglucosaminyl deacetylase